MNVEVLAGSLPDLCVPKFIAGYLGFEPPAAPDPTLFLLPVHIANELLSLDGCLCVGRFPAQ